MADYQFVIFKIDDREFAVDINKVNTIEKIPCITRVPGAPYFVMGVINLRGEVIPVVDTRKRMDMNSKPFDDESRIIIINLEDCVVGITADSATEVLSVGEELIDRDFATTGVKDDDFIEGVARLDQRIIVILDINKLLRTA